MSSVRRSCQLALSTSKFTPHLNNVSRRPFSQSSACERGTLPLFHEPSTPELATILTTINRRVLLPLHLTKDQAKLVYKLENKTKLEAEPIEITLGDVTYPLEHLNVNKDIPPRWPTVKKVVDLSKTDNDWENVVRMMEGFHDAGKLFKPSWKEMIVNKLADAGQYQLMFRTAQRAAVTGLRLDNPSLIKTVFATLEWRALNSNWDAQETKKALILAEQFTELLEDDEHMGRKVTVTTGDVRASPFTIALLLELAAARAKKHTGGNDVDGKVARYSTRLLQATKQDEFLTATLPDMIKVVTTPIEPQEAVQKTAGLVRDAKMAMRDLTRLWTAIRVAKEVLGSQMPMPADADKLENELRTELQNAEQALKALDELSQHRFKQTMTGLTKFIGLLKAV
ncbi:hypothetical protein K504DRAFT_474378 [Pleomassaria siparia CBS 279.74]|uniref:Uncharacterized protein n=1 Tax=Pleomassaria siparia CBS 279.74 TaxID=1314801 RepID=A0A6G1JRD5_9PLEO|nr:hypothetical protein K504DRAFT_474378 [Pleomassaria siparia CBS 279.74]